VCSAKGGFREQTNIIHVNRERPTQVWSGLWMEEATDIISPIARMDTLYRRWLVVFKLRREQHLHKSQSKQNHHCQPRGPSNIQPPNRWQDRCSQENVGKDV
jgi:hypothetical protein